MKNKFSNFIMRFDNMIWEYRLGIESRGYRFNMFTSENHYYATISYFSILSVLRRAGIRHEDVFYDIGCGKGRVLCCAQLFHPSKVIGVEIDTDLSRVAASNLEKMKGRECPYEVFAISATECDYSSGTVFYLFNPFGRSTLRETLSLIERSVSVRPRNVRIIYVNPMFEDEFWECSWLKRFDTWKSGRMLGLSHDVSFWESTC